MNSNSVTLPCGGDGPWPKGGSKWSVIINLVLTILTAIASSLGMASCAGVI